jgi:hypothetical protein
VRQQALCFVLFFDSLSRSKFICKSAIVSDPFFQPGMVLIVGCVSRRMQQCGQNKENFGKFSQNTNGTLFL